MKRRKKAKRIEEKNEKETEEDVEVEEQYRKKMNSGMIYFQLLIHS